MDIQKEIDWYVNDILSNKGWHAYVYVQLRCLGKLQLQLNEQKKNPQLQLWSTYNP